jgi:flagellar assembly protein FliH
MPTVIKAVDRQFRKQGVAFDLDDTEPQTEAFRSKIRDQARQILLAAMHDAQGIRRAAELEGIRAAEQALDGLVEERVGRKLETALPALRAAITEMNQSKQTWLAIWERQVVDLAVAIAGRVCRIELRKKPEITIGLVREALDLAAGAGGVRVLLNPEDHAALGNQVRILVDELTRLAPADVVADRSISRGGCRVETPKGAIDQQIETQLARIAEELT